MSDIARSSVMTTKNETKWIDWHTRWQQLYDRHTRLCAGMMELKNNTEDIGIQMKMNICCTHEHFVQNNLEYLKDGRIIQLCDDNDSVISMFDTIEELLRSNESTYSDALAQFSGNSETGQTCVSDKGFNKI